MSVKENTGKILAELTENLERVRDEEFDRLADAILGAHRIFTAGMGRSGAAMRGFTNRLMHLGFSVSSVGEISCPHTGPGDLLIIGSGSGETESLAAMARKAKKNGVKIALITMDADSTIGKLADVTVILPGVSPKRRHQDGEVTSIQPMGSLFEQLSFLTYDGMILELMERTGETSETMFARHADLE